MNHEPREDERTPLIRNQSAGQVSARPEGASIGESSFYTAFELSMRPLTGRVEAPLPRVSDIRHMGGV